MSLSSLLRKSRLGTVEEVPEATASPVFSILEIQRAFDAHSEFRQQEHLRIIYNMGHTTAEVRTSITWEALARIKSEMEGAGKTISQQGVLDFVLLPWLIEQLKLSFKSMEGPPHGGYLLDFGSAPKPPLVREMLIRYGLLAS